MSPVPIEQSAAGVDLSPRVFKSATVDASPADATETAVCSVTVLGDLSAAAGILLIGWCTFTVGTLGAAVTTKLRRTSAAGTTIKASGATNGDVAAAKLIDRTIVGFDTSPTLPGQVYVLTLTVGSATAASTVSAAELVAIAI